MVIKDNVECKVIVDKLLLTVDGEPSRPDIYWQLHVEVRDSTSIVRSHAREFHVKIQRVAVVRAKVRDVNGPISAERVGNISLMRAGGEDELCRQIT